MIHGAEREREKEILCSLISIMGRRFPPVLSLLFALVCSPFIPTFDLEEFLKFRMRENFSGILVTAHKKNLHMCDVLSRLTYTSFMYRAEKTGMKSCGKLSMHSALPQIKKLKDVALASLWRARFSRCHLGSASPHFPVTNGGGGKELPTGSVAQLAHARQTEREAQQCFLCCTLTITLWRISEALLTECPKSNSFRGDKF